MYKYVLIKFNEKEKIMFLTIIIPFYNAMPYLTELIKSITSQDLTGVEIILVNDGSTDDFEDALEKIRHFSNIKIFSTENNGVSSAKNLGLKNASAKYVWFVDADDLIEENAIVKMKKLIESYEKLPDIIFTNFKGINYQTKEIEYESHFNFGIFETNTAIFDDPVFALFGKAKINYSVSFQLFSREFMINNSLFFDTNLKASEDFDMKFESIVKAKSFGYLSDYSYLYRLPCKERKTLTVSSYSNEEIIQILKMYLKWYQYFKDTYKKSDGSIIMKELFTKLIDMTVIYLEKQDRSDVIAAFFEKEKNKIELVLGRNINMNKYII